MPSLGIAYLNRLRKPALVDIAEKTDLQDYGEYTKPELINALDDHLIQCQEIFSNDEALSEFYRRLTTPGRGGSPVKREPRSTASPFTEKKTPGRRSIKQKEEEIQEKEKSESSESDEPDNVTTIKTPISSLRTSARSIIESASAQLPPSPAVVTDAIDRQTTKMREGLADAWLASGVLECSHSLRSTLSSVKVVETIITLVELGSLLKELVPFRYLLTTPEVSAIHLPAIPIKVPDVFVLLTSVFWAPLLVWALTSLILPLLAAYFINISLQATGGLRPTSSRASFDPLSFNIAKALLVYKVYADHFSYFDLFSSYSIRKVRFSVPGQWQGMLTGTAIGVIGTLYEAILRRS
ncbi:hypothetical protein N7495_000770 [Penicillium taxi]|uniref:uncharacterized protein n=1 Tax=Penicillium taxi TaxID=168475 RepID=UPI0025451916|nr:uncharacterized protein N7495_000770 [Penicillium taxi]KAJ5908088.1 hypothetical protein N7495_000770 [Penicillium taxi]